MLDHAVDAILVQVSFLRFVCSPAYRRHKIQQWRDTSHTRGGQLVAAGEIVAGVTLGLGLPLVIIWVLFVAFQSTNR